MEKKMFHEEFSTISPSVTAAVVYRKVNWAILPLFCLIAASCYIDRTNLAFASIQLNHDLDFTAQVYGLGSGLFFLGYSLFMVPSNLAMTRIGAPRWLGLLVTCWGVVAASFSQLSSARQFYWLRFLLGAVEAGAFPGMWYFLYLFYPVDHMTVPLAVIEAAVAGANVVSAPLAAMLLLMQGFGGLAGWQWLFLLEGLATVALGLVTATALPLGLASATFLTATERHWLAQRIESQQAQQPGPGGGGGGVVGAAGPASAGAPLILSPRDREGGSYGSGSDLGSGGRGGGGGGGAGAGFRGQLMEAVLNGRVWYVALMGLLKNMAGHGILFWAPIINKALLQRQDMDPVQLDWSRHRGGDVVAAAADRGAADDFDEPDGRPGLSIAAVLITGVPFLCAAAMSLWIGRRSQAKRERAIHLAVPYFVSALLLASLPRLAATAPLMGFLAVTAAVACVQGTNSIINSYIPAVAPGGSGSGVAVSVSLALYNAVASLGGLLGPWLIGELVWRTGGYGDAFRVLGAVMGASAVMAWRTRGWWPPTRGGGPAGALGVAGAVDELVGPGAGKELDEEDGVY